MSQQLYTSAEIAAMTVANLKQALRTHGQSIAGKKTALVARLTAVAGPAASPPQRQQGSTTNAPTIQDSAATSGAPSGGGMTTQNTTQEFDDLMSAMGMCGLPRDVAEKFVAMQTITKLPDLLNFNVEDMESAITMHNKALQGTSEVNLRITNHMAFQRLKALVHRIHVWNLAGKELLLPEWSKVNQVIQAVQELQAFEQREKNKSEPTEFPDDVKPDMLDSVDAEKVFIQIRSTLTQCTSGNGHGSTLEYLAREPTWHVSTTPTVAQEMTANLPLRGLIYESDNSRFFTLLEKFCINHTSWNTIKRFKESLDGRSAYLALRRLYQGEDHVQSKINVEKQRISDGDEGLKYTGEIQIKFVNYASILRASYDYIGQHRETHSERTMVERLLQGFKGEARDNATLHWARMHIKDNPLLKEDYEAAVAYLATKVQEAYPSVAGKVPPTRSVSETNQEPSGRGGGESAERNQDREQGVTDRGFHRGGGD